MICYVDADGFALSLTPVPGGIKVDAPDQSPLTSQHQLVNGQWTVSEVIPQRVLNEFALLKRNTQLKKVREIRDALLLASDWSQLPDVPEATRTLWATYRQALRDVTAQEDLNNVIWPTSPV